MRRTCFQHSLLTGVLAFSLVAAFSFLKPERATKSESPFQQRSVTNQPIATIPVEIPSYGIVFLKAQINNSSPLSFALDSGASFPFVINSSKAEPLGLLLEGELESSGGAGEGAYNIKFARGVSVRVPGLTLRQQTAAVIDLTGIETLAGRDIDGLVGSNIFKRFVVEVDYEGHAVKLYDPTTYNYTGPGESLPLTVENDYLFVTARLALTPRESVSGKFLIDTGGGMVTAVLTTPFVESKNVVSMLGKTIRDDSLTGLGGNIKLLVSRAHGFQIGNITIRQPIVHLSQNETGALASTAFDGVIGSELLNRLRVIFDASRRRLILEPNINISRPSEYNMTGISVRATGKEFKRFTVYQVLKDSPGSEAGVRKGDLVAQINGRPATEFTLDDIYRMFKESHSGLRLTLSRATKTVVAEIKPRRMI